MRKIKLMADYQCFPLWEASPGVVGNIDPSELPISEVLQKRLSIWASQFDSALDDSDPASSGFENSEAVEAFKADGLELVKRLQSELGSEYVVVHKISGYVKTRR